MVSARRIKKKIISIRFIFVKRNVENKFFFVFARSVGERKKGSKSRGIVFSIIIKAILCLHITVTVTVIDILRLSQFSVIPI